MAFRRMRRSSARLTPVLVQLIFAFTFFELEAVKLYGPKYVLVISINHEDSICLSILIVLNKHDCFVASRKWAALRQ